MQAFFVDFKISPRAVYRPKQWGPWTVAEDGPTIWSATCIFLLSYPFFWLVDTRHPALIWLAMGAWAFAEGVLYGITGVFIAELFPVQLRYSGISFGYQVAVVLGGGLAPIIATALTQWARGASWAVATYLACIALIASPPSV